MVSIGTLGGAIVLKVVVMIDDLGPTQAQSGDGTVKLTESG
jgi:hypothetical protein